jgi:hypothetical protein
VRRAASFKALRVIMLGFGLYRAAGAIKLVCRKFSDQLGRVKDHLTHHYYCSIGSDCSLVHAESLAQSRILDPENALDVDPLSPNIGPVFYGGMFEPPSIQPEGMRSRNEWHD